MKSTLFSLARMAPILATLGAPGAAWAAPDPAVSLTLERPVAGFQTPLFPGEVLTWWIGVDNLGDAAASNVVLRAPIPGGMNFIVGSLSNVDTQTMTVRYSSDNGESFAYLPVGAPGEADPAVTDVRIDMPTLGQNPAGTATFNTLAAFSLGAFTSTWYEPGVGLRVDGGAPAGDWLSPSFPPSGTSPVVSWTSIAISDSTVTGIADALYDIIDPVTGTAIAGFEGVRPTNGILDISGISASSHPQLAVRANLTADTSSSCFSEVLDQNLPDDPCTPDLLGITNNDVVFGNLWRNGEACREKPFRWTPSSGMTVLSSLVDDTVAAYGYAMNDAGVMVGESMTADLATTHAVLWGAGDTAPTDVHGSLGAGVSSWLTDINASGTFVGTRGGAAAGPFRGTAGSLTTYDGLPSASWDWRPRIGADGTVAGRYLPEGETLWRAYRWAPDGTFLDLGAPGDVHVITGVGPSGMVIGYGAGNQDGFVWTATGGTVALGEGFAGGDRFVATAVGPTGTVYGSYIDASGFRRPFAWTAAGGISAIDSSPWNNGEALDVNGNGDVFVAGYDPTLLTAPFARVGFLSGGSTSWLPTPGQIPEVFGQRLAHEGYSTFNDSRHVIGYYRTAEIVAGAPAEIPFFAGDCGDVAPVVSSVQARWESSVGLTVGFDAVYAAESCSADDLATVTVNADVDGDTTNNMAFDVLRLAQPDVTVQVTSDIGILQTGGLQGITWEVVVRNLGAEDAPVQVVLDLPPDASGEAALGGIDTTGGGTQVLGVTTLGPGAAQTFTYTSFHYTETTGLDIAGVATVDTPVDCDTSNNTASATVRSGSGENLRVTTLAPATVQTGGTLATQVVFGSNGAASFDGQATLTISLGGLPIASATADAGPFTLNFTPGDTFATVTVDGATTGSLDPVQSWTVTLTATAPECVANANGTVTTSALWAGSLGGPLDDNPTDDTASGTTLLVGDSGDNPAICPTPCDTVADCPVSHPACEGAVECIANVGCVYNAFDLGFDADDNLCTTGERCLEGALVTDAVTCEAQCGAAIGATCNAATGQCQDVLPPGSGGDTDGDGIADICDVCASDYYDCTGERSAVYAIVNGPSGSPVGTIRCFRANDGSMTCDTSDGVELVVYPDLVCPQ